MQQLGWGRKHSLLRKKKRCKKGLKKPDLSSLTQMEREVLAPMLGCRRVSVFQLCCSEDITTFLPLTNPCKPAKANCSHWAVPL